MAMVKANAYGHGIRSTAKRLEGLVDKLGVASIEEALALRESGIGTPIVLMQGPYQARDIVRACVEKFDIVIHHQTQIEWIKQLRVPLPLNVWLKINIGMSRLGFELEEAYEALKELSYLKQVCQPINLMGHFSHADLTDSASVSTTQQQIASFEYFISSAPCPIGQKSLCNSAGMLHYPSAHFDLLRPGLTIYGVSPFEGQIGADFGLRPVMTLQSSLIAVNMRPAGARVGYGGEYVCPERMPVGIVAFGYGDGFPVRCEKAVVRIGDGLCPVIGKVSMDMMAVDLRSSPQATIGTDVLLWGEDFPVERLAHDTAQMPWALLTQIQTRVKFLWTPA
jgi:alanine racemase